MSKQKYYYATISKPKGKLQDSINTQVMIYTKKRSSDMFSDHYETVRIPAEELNQLIKKYRKK